MTLTLSPNLHYVYLNVSFLYSENQLVAIIDYLERLALTLSINAFRCPHLFDTVISFTSLLVSGASMRGMCDDLRYAHFMARSVNVQQLAHGLR